MATLKSFVARRNGVPGVADMHARQRRRLRRHALQASLWLTLWLVLVNLIVWRFPAVWQPGRSRHPASVLTRDLAAALTRPLEIDCVMYADHPLYDALRLRLKQYREAARQTGTEPIQLRFIDPRRDVRLMDAVLDDLGGATEAILLRYGMERRRLLPEEMIERRVMLDNAGIRHETVGYLVDAMLAAAIRDVVTASPRNVYVLEGHGERRFDDYNEQTGYSDIARLLQRQGYTWAALNLARTGKVPADAAALLIIGPRSDFTRDELDLLRDYLVAGGRVMALLDAGRPAGFERLLAEWHLFPLAAVASGKAVAGDALVVIDYGLHPVTRSLANTLTLFARPGVLALHAPPGDSAESSGQDRVQATVLAGIDGQGWYRFLPDEALAGASAGQLQRGPAALAVALERGGASDVRVPPARLVVIGDSRLADNGMLALGAAGNRDLFVNALAWLTDHKGSEPSLDADPTLQVVLSRRGWTQLWYGVVFVWPGLWCLLGLFVLRHRGRSTR